MLMHKIALAGAAAAALLVTSAPALAFTHHPATPAEIQATDDLNAKALADARSGTAGTQPTASTNPQPAMTPASPTQTPDQNMTAPTPSPDANAPMPAPTDATPAPANPQPSPTNNSGVNTPDTTTAPAPTQPEPPVNGQ